MAIRIKDWHKFQHFRDRKPPWVKLYRDILDDLEWHELSPASAKSLVMLWLIASEYDNGELPDMKTIAFRLRVSKSQAESIVSSLSHWLIQDDIASISERHQSDRPETETETEGERETDSAASRLNGLQSSFSEFWQAYPKKVGKGAAEKAWIKIHPDRDLSENILSSLRSQVGQAQWVKEGGQFIPNPATWLNQKRWQDEAPDRNAETRDTIERAAKLLRIDE